MIRIQRVKHKFSGMFHTQVKLWYITEAFLLEGLVTVFTIEGERAILRVYDDSLVCSVEMPYVGFTTEDVFKYRDTCYCLLLDIPVGWVLC